MGFRNRARSLPAGAISDGALVLPTGSVQALTLATDAAGATRDKLGPLDAAGNYRQTAGSASYTGDGLQLGGGFVDAASDPAMYDTYRTYARPGFPSSPGNNGERTLYIAGPGYQPGAAGGGAQAARIRMRAARTITPSVGPWFSSGLELDAGEGDVGVPSVVDFVAGALKLAQLSNDSGLSGQYRGHLETGTISLDGWPLPFRVWLGTVTVPVTASNLGTQQTVDFTAAGFTTAPLVFALTRSTALWVAMLQGGATATSCGINVRHIDGTATTANVGVNVLALQATPTSAIS